MCQSFWTFYTNMKYLYLSHQAKLGSRHFLFNASSSSRYFLYFSMCHRGFFLSAFTRHRHLASCALVNMFSLCNYRHYMSPCAKYVVYKNEYLTQLSSCVKCSLVFHVFAAISHWRSRVFMKKTVSKKMPEITIDTSTYIYMCSIVYILRRKSIKTSKRKCPAVTY